MNKKVKLPFVASIKGSEIPIIDGKFITKHKMLTIQGCIENGKVQFTMQCNFEISENVEIVQRLLDDVNNAKVKS